MGQFLGWNFLGCTQENTCTQPIIVSVYFSSLFSFFLPSFLFWPHHVTCRILVPRPGIETARSTVKAHMEFYPLDCQGIPKLVSFGTWCLAKKKKKKKPTTQSFSVDVNVRDGPDIFHSLKVLALVEWGGPLMRDSQECSSGSLVTTPTKACIYSTWKVLSFCISSSSVWTSILLEGLEVRRAVSQSSRPHQSFSIITYPLPSPFMSACPTSLSGQPNQSDSRSFTKVRFTSRCCFPGCLFPLR